MPNIGIEPDPKPTEEQPQQFAKYLEFLGSLLQNAMVGDDLQRIEQALQIDLTPLTKVGGDTTLLNIIEIRSLYRTQEQAKAALERELAREAANWQPIENVVNAVRNLQAGLAKSPQLAERAVQRDLKILEEQLTWYRDKGVQKVRLYLA